MESTRVQPPTIRKSSSLKFVHRQREEKSGRWVFMVQSSGTDSSSSLPEPTERVDRLARTVIDAALEVHTLLGPGFLESIYEEALTLELEHRGVPFQRQVPVTIRYKGTPIGEARADLLVGGDLIVELKAVEALAPIHVAQVISYLRAFDCQLGLLITFNVQLLRTGVRRVILSRVRTNKKMANMANLGAVAAKNRQGRVRPPPR